MTTLLLADECGVTIGEGIAKAAGYAFLAFLLWLFFVKMR